MRCMYVSVNLSNQCVVVVVMGQGHGTDKPLIYQYIWKWAPVSPLTLWAHSSHALQVRNLGAGGSTCLDSPARRANLHKPVGLYPCHKQGGNQVTVQGRVKQQGAGES